MKYITAIQKGVMVVLQNEFESPSDEDALKVHASHIEICEKDITADWDNAYLVAVDEHGNISKWIS